MDAALALLDGSTGALLVQLVPHLPMLLMIIKMLKEGVEQYCQLHLAVEPPVYK